MRNVWKIIGVATVVTVVAVAALSAVAFAQEPDTPPFTPPWMNGDHPVGSRDFLHTEELEEAMHTAIAEALGLTVEEFDAARADGQTLWQIAEAQGVDLNDVWSAMNEVRQEAIQQAVDDGLITQEQADWMADHAGPHGPGLHGGGNCDGDGPAGGPFGGMRGGRGMHGGFRGFPPQPGATN
ncbi:MAG: hypothetical protein ACE5G8_03350 [Anaerolineae bacterium]